MRHRSRPGGDHLGEESDQVVGAVVGGLAVVSGVSSGAARRRATDLEAAAELDLQLAADDSAS